MDYFSVNSIHPASIKHALKGHPWITKDSFSSKWPKDKKLLHIKLNSQKVCTYLHDPQHPFCIARLIHTEKIMNLNEWKNILEQRMAMAIKKRKDWFLQKQRNHFWYVFGESDLLPGLFVLSLNGNIVIQTQMSYWDENIKEIIVSLKKIFEQNSIMCEYFWWQPRSQGQQLPKVFENDGFRPKTHTFWVEEAGVQIRIDLGERYDYGIYTDMAGIREHILQQKEFFKNKSVLNLFSYTGAYSVIALKHGANYCCSLDSSKRYLQILDENLKKNELDNERHKSLEVDIFKGLKQFQEKKNQFDIIILDPPSSFTSQGKKVQAFQIYPEILRESAKVASSKANLLCFLNHHQKTRSQFEVMIRSTLPQWKIVRHFELCEDIGLLPYFPEGDYLKGIMLEKK
jgi:23S rRNA (cytosine1962-C5)-methyltransferase